MRLLGQDNTIEVSQIDMGIRNPWKWPWLHIEIQLHFNSKLNTYIVFVSDFFKKIDSKGKARCIVCEKDILYGNKGYSALKNFKLNTLIPPPPCLKELAALFRLF